MDKTSSRVTGIKKEEVYELAGKIQLFHSRSWQALLPSFTGPSMEADQTVGKVTLKSLPEIHDRLEEEPPTKFISILVDQSKL